ncbi:membrane protein [Labrys miyagiensis]
MGGESLLVFLVVGIIAGWLAGLIMSGGGFGLIGDLVVGVVGAFLSGWLIRPHLNIDLGNMWVNDIVFALIGAIILIFVLRLFKRA